MASVLRIAQARLVHRGMCMLSAPERADLLAGIAYGVVLFVTVFAAAGAVS